MGLLEFSFLIFLATVMIKAVSMFIEAERIIDEEARLDKIERVYMARKAMYEKEKSS